MALSRCVLAAAWARPACLKSFTDLNSEPQPPRSKTARTMVRTNLSARIGLLMNPTNANAADVTKDMTAASAAMGVQLEVVQGSNILEIDTAFASLVRNRVDGL